MEGDETGETPVAEKTADNRQQGEAAGYPSKKMYSKCVPKGNQRIDKLAVPNKRKFLALWKGHAHRLPEQKTMNLKLILQQLYVMSFDDAKYFAELRAQAKAALEKKKLKQRLNKYLEQEDKEKQRERAYCLFKKIVKCGVSYAVENPIPPLVSVRLRRLSNIILEQLCKLRKVEVPNRSVVKDSTELSNDAKLGKFLISIADWMAIAMERLHYVAQVSIDELTGRVQPVDICEYVRDASCGTSLEGEPLATSTPRQCPVKLLPDSFSRLFGEPQAASTPKQSPIKLPPGSSTRPLRESKTSTMHMKAKYSHQDNLVDDCPAKLPYYSFIEDEKNTGNGTTFNTTGVYNTSGFTKWSEGPSIAKGHLELPPYSFKDGNPSAKRHNTECKGETVKGVIYPFIEKKIKH